MGLLTTVTDITWAWSTTALLALTLLLATTLPLAIHRLYFSPIAHVPGPALAAATWWYELYHDVLRGGQYTFHILELHKRYGPIVRINPSEVHIADPSFFHELYTTTAGRRRDKWEFYARQFGADASVFSTVSHDVHRARRAALNPYFSAARVREVGEGLVNAHVENVLRRLREHAQSTTTAPPLDLAVVFAAFTNDVINEYAFGQGEKLVDRADFGRGTHASILRGTEMGTFAKHMPWVLGALDALPDAWTERVVPGWDEFNALRRRIRTRIAEMKEEEGGETAFHGLLESSALPEAERTVERLAQEGQVLNQGGTLTSSNALCIAVFHLLDKPECLRKLQGELLEQLHEPEEAGSLAKLQALPYLGAVVKESLRLGSGGTGTRLGRVAPDETLRYVERTTADVDKVWVIPPGTAVGMTPYQILLDDEVYPDPFRFDPERWLGADMRRKEESFVIFKAGARSCLGKSLALAEMYLMLGQLFLHWAGCGEETEKVSNGGCLPGVLGRMRLFETTVADTEMAADRFIPVPYKGSKGVRVVLETASYPREVVRVSSP